MCYTLDMRELSITRGMTRAIIAAQKNLEEAIAAIMAARVQIPKPEMSSGVLDDVDDDGYKLIFETDWAHLVNRDWIGVWLGVALGTRDEAANVDDWDAGLTGLSERWSIVADGGNRCRIDKWWAMYGTLRPKTVRIRGYESDHLRFCKLAVDR